MIWYSRSTLFWHLKGLTFIHFALEIFGKYQYDYHPIAKVKWAVSSAVEHTLHTRGVTGSIPVPPTNLAGAARRVGGLDFCLFEASISVIRDCRVAAGLRENVPVLNRTLNLNYFHFAVLKAAVCERAKTSVSRPCAFRFDLFLRQ